MDSSTRPTLNNSLLARSLKNLTSIITESEHNKRCDSIVAQNTSTHRFRIAPNKLRVACLRRVQVWTQDASAAHRVAKLLVGLCNLYDSWGGWSSAKFQILV